MGIELDFIKRCAREGRVYWSYHSNMRLAQRRISREVVLLCIQGCKVIQEYVEDYPLPSCLCLGYDGQDEAVHMVIGLDNAGENIRIVTVYRPDVLRWEDDFLKRRKM